MLNEMPPSFAMPSGSVSKSRFSMKIGDRTETAVIASRNCCSNCQSDHATWPRPEPALSIRGFGDGGR